MDNLQTKQRDASLEVTNDEPTNKDHTCVLTQPWPTWIQQHYSDDSWRTSHPWPRVDRILGRWHW